MTLNAVFDQILEAVPHKTTAVQLPASHLTNYPSFNKQDMLGTVVEVGMKSYTCIDTPVLDDKERLTFISSVWTLDASKRTS